MVDVCRRYTVVMVFFSNFYLGSAELRVREYTEEGQVANIPDMIGVRVCVCVCVVVWTEVTRETAPQTRSD